MDYYWFGSKVVHNCSKCYYPITDDDTLIKDKETGEPVCVTCYSGKLDWDYETLNRNEITVKINKKGFTLLEVLITTAIASIILLGTMQWLAVQAKMSSKIEKKANNAVEQLAELQAKAQLLSYCPKDEHCAGRPIICLGAGWIDNAIGCTDRKPCSFDSVAKKWKRPVLFRTATCQDGMLMLNVLGGE